MTLLALDKIRRLYGAKDPQWCPHCTHALTVETTQFFKTTICENCFEHAVIEEVDGCCSARQLENVKYVVEGGSIQVRQQCKSCGWVSGNSIGGLTKEARESLPEIDKGKRDQFEEKKFSFRRDFNSRASEKKAAKKKEKWMQEYNKYLQSPEWHEKRMCVLRRDKHLCQCCLNAMATQVHHKSYEFVDLNGSEPAFDLVAICTPCHEKIEQMKRNMKGL